MVNTDSRRKNLFPYGYHKEHVRNNEIPFHGLKAKFTSAYNLAIKYLNEYYGLSKVDYKLYYSNLLCNNRYIDDYQEIHRNVTVEFPHTVFNARNTKNTKK